MNLYKSKICVRTLLVTGLLFAAPGSALSAEKALLDILLENGVITQEQHQGLLTKETLTTDDILAAPQAEAAAANEGVVETNTAASGNYEIGDADMSAETDPYIDIAVADALATKIDEDFPVKSSYGSNGFRLETRDGNWQTNLQWRAQLRYTNPFFGDPASGRGLRGHRHVKF